MVPSGRLQDKTYKYDNERKTTVVHNAWFNGSRGYVVGVRAK